MFSPQNAPIANIPFNDVFSSGDAASKGTSIAVERAQGTVMSEIISARVSGYLRRLLIVRPRATQLADGAFGATARQSADIESSLSFDGDASSDGMRSRRR